ncbi:MAG: TSUP family transporter [Clostridiales bacterium]|nr:TSUP family transporter [Clostridiales bacterium]
MSFYLYVLAGFFSGMLGGMGMGGGTILIPVLTIFLGVGQHAAQAANLIAFLPMALFSLKMHKDRGLLKTEGVSGIVIPALITSVATAFATSLLSGEILGKLFGAFLIFLGIKGLFTVKIGHKN